LTAFLSSATAWLGNQLLSAGATDGVYARGSQRVGVRCIKVPVKVEQITAGGMTIEGQRIDWLIPAADLVLAGSQQTPDAGDTLEVLEGVQRNTYELQPVGTDSHYRPREDGLVRIHTRLVSEA
jgi:hypothetical protein